MYVYDGGDMYVYEVYMGVRDGCICIEAYKMGMCVMCVCVRDIGMCV
jgi:hypothetical protein